MKKNSTEIAKPKVCSLGKAIIEPTGFAGEFFVLTPDGVTRVASSEAQAEKIAKAWADRHRKRKAINILVVETRS